MHILPLVLVVLLVAIVVAFVKLAKSKSNDSAGQP